MRWLTPIGVVRLLTACSGSGRYATLTGNASNKTLVDDRRYRALRRQPLMDLDEAVHLDRALRASVTAPPRAQLGRT